MGPDDLVLCSGTLPRGTPFTERVSAAAAAGFTGISLWGRDCAAAHQQGLTDSDMAHMLADHGLAVGELDPAWWWLPGASEIHIPPELDSEDIFRFGETQLFAMAEAVELDPSTPSMSSVARGTSMTPPRPSPDCADGQPSTICSFISSGFRGRRSPT